MNLSALRSSDFRLYFAGAVANVNAMWIVRIVVGWLAWDITGSPSFVGLVASASLIPTLLLGPFFGVVVDRSDITRAAYATNICMVLVVAILLLCHVLGLMLPAVLLVLSLAIGLVTAAHHPVRLSLGPRLVAREHVSSVIALGALNFNVARLISPALGGLMIDRLGITTALVITLAMFMPNLAILFRLHPRSLSDRSRQVGFATAMNEGLVYVRQHRKIIVVLMMTFAFSITLRGILEVLPIIADGIYGLGVVGLGQLGSAVGGGALIAALFKSLGGGRVDARDRASSLINMSVAAVGVLSMAVLGLALDWWVTILCAAMLGMCGTYFGVTMQSLIQADLPDDVRGRVMSIWIVVGLGSTALGSLVLGVLIDVLGMTPSTVGLAVLTGLAIAAVAVWDRVGDT